MTEASVTASASAGADLRADPRARQLALGATGLLRAFNAAGVLHAADVHVAVTLGRLAGESDERVLLAVALVTRAVREGSVCLALASVAESAADASTVVEASTAGDAVNANATGLPWPEPSAWVAAVRRSPLVANGVLRWEHDLLYLDRYYQQEAQLAADLAARAAQPAPPTDAAALDVALQRVLPGEGYAEQRAASQRAVKQWTTLITGGPGAGKTTAVAGLLAALAEQAELAGVRRPRIALCAPTGKAAARLQEAVADASSALPAADQQRLGDLAATTLHRLLGSLPGTTTRFRHHRGNRLPHDLVVVDETSMVSLTLMTRLLEAMRTDARLVLVGDPDQLASIEAGAVLADLVAGFERARPEAVARLESSHRFGPDIAALARAVRQGDADQVVALLRGGSPHVQFVDADDPTPMIRPALQAAALEVRRQALAGDGAAAVAALGRHRLMCARRDGPFGVSTWNRRVEQWLTEATGDPLWDPVYAGRPLLVTANDYAQGVFNGDTGVVVRGPDGGLTAYLGGSGKLLALAPARLGAVETMHAMTIHKSQGSQADTVTVLLPGEQSRLLTRELLYTAITRAKEAVCLVGSEAEVRAAVERPVRRASGLRQRLDAQQLAPVAPGPASANPAGMGASP